jgi:hypothetical protein
MIMYERSRRLSEPLHWGRREKTAVAVVLTCAVLVVIALAADALRSGAPTRADCIDVTFPSTLGGARLHECGAKARSVCASPSPYRGIAPELSAACRRAGFPFNG